MSLDVSMHLVSHSVGCDDGVVAKRTSSVTRVLMPYMACGDLSAYDTCTSVSLAKSSTSTSITLSTITSSTSSGDSSRSNNTNSSSSSSNNNNTVSDTGPPSLERGKEIVAASAPVSYSHFIKAIIQ
jgi:hypothetical protein